MTNLNSIRRAARLGLIAGTLLLAFAFAIPSFAGTDNPDVLDIDINLNATSGSSLDSNRVIFRTGQSAYGYSYDYASNEETPGSYLKGYAFNYDSETGIGVNLMWFAFEPDSVKRKETGASMRQKSNIAMGVYMYGSSTSARTDLVEGCSAKGKIKIADTTKASASLKCPKSVWTDLGFNEDQAALIKETLGSTKLKFGYKGVVLR